MTHFFLQFKVISYSPCQLINLFLFRMVITFSFSPYYCPLFIQFVLLILPFYGKKILLDLSVLESLVGAIFTLIVVLPS